MMSTTARNNATALSLSETRNGTVGARLGQSWRLRCAHKSTGTKDGVLAFVKPVLERDPTLDPTLATAFQVGQFRQILKGRP